jgi:hypothetical protein
MEMLGNLKVFFLTFFLFLSGATATGSNFYQFTVRDIDAENVEMIYDSIRAGDRVHLVFNSHGGKVSIADQLIQAIQDNPNVTGEVVTCLSACTFIAASVGRENLRVNEFSTFGVHHPYLVNIFGGITPANDTYMIDLLYNTFKAGGFDADFLLGATISTPPQRLRFLTHNEMRKAGFIFEDEE